MSWFLEYLHPIRTELATAAQPTLLSQLRDILDAIYADRFTQDIEDRIVEIIELAHKTMSSASSQAVLYRWRCFHTDACLIRSIILLYRTAPLEAIASLDTAIIISGATGDNRLHTVQKFIQEIQRRYMPATAFTIQLDHLVRSVTDVDPLASAALPILKLESPPSLLAFQSMYFRQPFVVPHYAKDWPAIQEHPWRSATYLRSISGAGRIVPVEVGNDYRSDNWSQRLVPWDEFLSTLDFVDQPCTGSAETMYLAQHNLFMQFPALRADIYIPDYVYADLENPDRPTPDNDERLAINVWLGPGGTISPAHTDPYYNMFLQLVGRKTVWLAPPERSPRMYPCVTSPTKYPVHEPELSNTTRVDVFGKRTASEAQYPEFWKEVMPKAMSCTLSAGDFLYIPAGWWHGMRSEDTSCSVSMWF